MANKLGGSPSSGGWKPPSGKFNPPFNGSADNRVGGVHGPSAGPMAPCPPANQTTTTNQANAVTRPPNGIRTK